MICFTLVGALVYWPQTSNTAVKKISLGAALEDLNNWDQSAFSPLDPEIIKSLQLDDYLNHRYINASRSVFVYVGYYLTSQKIGAAHDPLVCYHGQGWRVANREKHDFLLNTDPAKHISYVSMIVESKGYKELVVYWYQSFDRTNSNTLFQKLGLLKSKFLDHREDNAFIRISTPMEGKSAKEGLTTINKFISDFYPIFLDYVKS